MRSEIPVSLLIAMVTALLPARDVAAQSADRPPFESLSPGACLRTGPLVREGVRWDLVLDSASYTPGADTALRAVRETMVRCAGTFTSATVPVWQLLHFARTRLVLGQDTEAVAAQTRYLRLLDTATAARRAWALSLIVRDLLEANPPRVAAATGRLGQLDRLGVPAAKARFLAHVAMVEAARRHWDDTTAIREADAAIIAWKDMPSRTALTGVFSIDLAQVFAQKAEIALRHGNISRARAVIDTAVVVVPPNSFGGRMVASIKRSYEALGSPAPPIEAKYWFHRREPLSTPKPTPGVVTVLSAATHSCEEWCEARFRAFRRWSVQFADRGFEPIQMTKTLGFYRDTAPVMPADEARYDSLYFYGVAGMPGALAVSETKYRFIPDGRRRNEPTPQETHYPNAEVIIVDRKGIIRYVRPAVYTMWGWDRPLEGPLTRFIETLLAEPAGTT